MIEYFALLIKQYIGDNAVTITIPKFICDKYKINNYGMKQLLTYS